jgi:DNA polymerase-3 subunit alpha
LLEEISKETYGVLIYQEQVMQAAQLLAGYTLGGADLLRRAMGKKKLEEMAKHRARFVEGCAKHNKIPESKANAIFDLLEKFAGYGFNKSHAAAYAIVAYQTAYLKANYTVEFLAAMLTNDMGDTDKVAILIEEARQFNVEVLPPDVNQSAMLFGPDQTGKAIRFGLAAIKGMGEIAVGALIKARQEGGPFVSLANMAERVDARTVNRKVLEALIKSGACDCFKDTRAGMFAQIDRVLARAASINADRQSGQSNLFDVFQDKPAEQAEKVVRVEEWPQHQLLAFEKELLGFYVTGHPLTPYADILKRYCLANSKTARDMTSGQMTRLGGLVTAIQQGVSKKSNKPYMMVTIEDLEGAVQMLVMNENYDKYRDLLAPNASVLVVGEVNNSEDKPKLFPQEIMPLDDAPRRYTRQVHLRLYTSHLTPERLEAARALVEQHPGKCPLFLCLRQPGGQTIFIQTNERFYVTPSRAFQKAADDLFGEETYYVKVDSSLPEKRERSWARKPRNGDGDSG